MKPTLTVPKAKPPVFPRAFSVIAHPTLQQPWESFLVDGETEAQAKAKSPPRVIEQMRGDTNAGSLAEGDGLLIPESSASFFVHSETVFYPPEGKLLSSFPTSHLF